MTNKALPSLIAIILFCIFFTSCNPSIKIIQPEDGASILKGEMVNISTEVESKQGKIKEVWYFIDGVKLGFDNDFPYRYSWFTNEVKPGKHTIKAVVYDSEGGKSSTEITINLTKPLQIPVAQFTANQTQVVADTPIQFKDNSSNLPNSWMWDFGDGHTSQEQNPSHVYKKTGIFTVSLQVKNESGVDTESKFQFITIRPKLQDYSWLTDRRDGKRYKVINIGKQIWMAENLNYSSPNSLVYDNNMANSQVYGRLYNWKTAQEACPSGWHLPSNSEWKTLINHLGGASEFETKVKQTGTEHWFKPNKKANNLSGFTALPSGYRNIKNHFYARGEASVFWTSSKIHPLEAWSIWIDQDESHFNENTNKLNYGFSVRCVKN